MAKRPTACRILLTKHYISQTPRATTRIDCRTSAGLHGVCAAPGAGAYFEAPGAKKSQV